MVGRIKLFALLVLTLILFSSIASSQLPVIKLNSEDKDSGDSFFSFFKNLFFKEKTQPTLTLLNPVGAHNIVSVESKKQSSGAQVLSVNVDSSKESSTNKKIGVGSFISSIISLSSKNVEQNDDNIEEEVFSKGDKKYVVRDGEDFLLDGTKSDAWIGFDPLPPNSVCEREEVSLTVNGYARAIPDSDDVIDCAFEDTFYVVWDLELMESDLGADDSLGFLVGGAYVDCDCVFDSFQCYFSFEKTFEDLNLAQEVIDDPGDEIEIYAKFYDLGGSDVEAMSTSTYNIYGYVNGECECLSGSCCDLFQRPYEIKNSGAQPTNYGDFYSCQGENSASGTSYVIFRDYFCNGVDSISHHTDSLIDTCGACAYCVDNAVRCSYYPPETVCGDGMVCNDATECIEDCICTSGACCDGCRYRENDYLCDAEYMTDYGCPDGAGTSNPGSDVFVRFRQRYCSGDSANCLGAITAWLDWFLYDSCSSDEYCTDGDSSCNGCGYHTQTGCYSGDVYWYDNCLNREDKKEDCGTAGCENGACVGSVECSVNLDCGTDSFVGTNYCYSGDVYKDYRVYTCNNPGTSDSYCSSSDSEQLVEDCNNQGCLNGGCLVQGDDGFFWAILSVNGGEDIAFILAQIDLNGNIIFSKNLSSTSDVLYAYGITRVGDEILLSKYDHFDSHWRNIERLNSRGQIVGKIYYDGFRDKFYDGLAWDGNNLWTTFNTENISMIDFNGNEIERHSYNNFQDSNRKYMDFADGKFVITDGDLLLFDPTDDSTEILSEAGSFSGVTWDGNYVWAKEYYSNSFKKISLAGDVVGSLDAPEGYFVSGIEFQSWDSCIEHNYYICSDGDVYWYDSCNRKEEKKNECDDSACISGACVGNTYEVSLDSGWNNLTLLHVPINNTVENVFSSIEGKYESVWGYSSGEWFTYSPDVLPDMNTLLKIESDNDYKIEMNQDGVVSFVYFPDDFYDVENECYSYCFEIYNEGAYCNNEFSLEINGQEQTETCYSLVRDYPGFGFPKCWAYNFCDK